MFNKIFSLLIIACIMPINLYAANGGNTEVGYAQCQEEFMCGAISGNCDVISEESESCSSSKEYFVGSHKVIDCTQCENGYNLVQATAHVSDRSDCVAYYHICEYCPTTCFPVCDDIIENHGSYQAIYKTSCECGTCKASGGATYQCAPGYYGSGTSCTQCPQATDIFTNSALTTPARGTSVAGANNSQSDCYLPAGTYYDAKGTINMKGPCKY